MKTILSAAIGALLALSAVEAGAQVKAAERKVELAIERLSLADALNEWAKQTGLQLVSQSSEKMNTTVAPRLKGEYTAQGALDELLKGTALTYEWVSERAVAIREKPLVVPAALQTSGVDQKQATVPVARFSGEAWAERRVAATDQRPGPGSPPARSAEEPDTEDLEELEEILVTGTHIRGSRNDTAPLVVIDREQIERTGYATTQDVVRSLPQNFAGGQAGASEDGIFGVGATAASNFTGASGVNLRGLGNSSTLVLLNGHRMAPSAYGSIVDVSLIPLAAVDRIEVLLDGSSALYGSDAVGGVVNIITRDDYEGLNTLVRYGEAASGGREDRIVAQTAGAYWDSGGIVLAAQYQDQGELRAADRRFAVGLGTPNDLLPAAESYGVAANFRQQLSDAFSLYADSLFSRRDIDRDYSFSGANAIAGTSDATSQGTNVAAGLRYQVAPRWSLDIGAQFSEQKDERSRFQVSSFDGEQRSSADVRFREAAADLILSGTLFTSPAGSTSMALGASYRRERLDRDEVLLTGAPIIGEFGRNVRAAFGELYVPLVGPTMAVPLVESLSLSGAVRWDDYSTLGSTSTPRIGVRWALTSDVSVRAAYSRSFRAPDPSELFNTDVAFAFTFPFVDANGDFVNALVLTGSQPSLEPERARITSVGVEYQPSGIPGLTVTADYYRVRYIDRIVLLTFDINALTRPDVYGSLITPFATDADAQRFLDEMIASGAEFFDDGTGVTGVRNAVDFRQQNAAHLEQSGVDFKAQYAKQYATGSLSTSATVSTITGIDTAFASGASSTDLVSTLGNPVDLRGRLEFGWDSNRWMLNAAVNYVDDYKNTGALGTPRIDSWTTVDLVARMKLQGFTNSAFFAGATLTLSAQNILDEEPPFVAAPDLISVNYDPANANPLQRVIALEFAKAW